MLNIPDSSDVLVVPSPYLDFCCVIAASRSSHRLVSVGIDLDSGRVRVCRRGGPGFDGAVCPAIVDRRMAPGPCVKGEQ